MKLESIADYLVSLADEDFKQMIPYMEVDDISEEEKSITLICDVDGGYEADVNVYYGGEEYVEDFINTIDIDDDVKFTVEYELDHSNMSCKIVIKF